MDRRRIVSGWCGLGVMLASAAFASPAAASPKALDTAARPGIDEGAPKRLIRPIRSSTSSLAGAPGYCSSSGGSTSYERITSLTLERIGGSQARVRVSVFIANPTGCVAGESCPEYDNSPEYVNVWVDWNHDQVWAPNERVLDASLTGYGNISYSGTLEAVGVVTIPAGVSGPFWARANLGWSYDPNDPCASSWTWGNVIDRQVLDAAPIVTKIEATKDHPIKGVGDVIWESPLNDECEPSETPDSLPIADSIFSTVTLGVTLESCPQPPDSDPIVKWTATLDADPATPATPVNHIQSGQFMGLSGSIDVSTVPWIGRHTLKLDFDIQDSGGNTLRTQTMRFPIYTTYSTPIQPVLDERWLRTACAWAVGAQTGEEVAGKVKTGLYTANVTYRDQSVLFPWQPYLEGTASTGNCFQFAYIWKAACRDVLGLAAVGDRTRRGSKNVGFLTVTGAVGPPPESLKGNAHPAADNMSTPFDRWRFGAHNYGTYQGVGYDPTFNKVYLTPDAFIEKSIIGSTVATIGGVPTQVSELEPAGGGNWVRSVQYIPPWGENEYKLIGSPVPVPMLFGLPQAFSSLAAAPHDNDADTVAEQLRITGVLTSDAEIEGNVSVQVSKGGTFITNRASVYSMLPASVPVVGTPGGSAFEVLVSGQDIQDAGLAGPYDVTLTFRRATSEVVSTGQFQTAAFAADDFGEYDLRFGAVQALAVDSDGDGLAEGLGISGGVFATKASSGLVVATIETAGVPIPPAVIGPVAFAPLESTAFAGLISGEAISGAALPGPYTVLLDILPDDGTFAAPQSSIVSPPYTPDQFTQPRVRFTGQFAEQALDDTGDGLFDRLVIDTEVECLLAGEYDIVGRLTAPDGTVLAASNPASADGEGVKQVALTFDGAAIAAAELDGPYSLESAVVTDADGLPVVSGKNLFATAAYAAAQFGQAEPPFIELTGAYISHAVDLDGDSLYDTLEVEVGVRPRLAGNVVIIASLEGPGGQAIQTTSGLQPLGDLEAGLVKLTFEGRRIFATLADGPLTLTDVLAYQTGDPDDSAFAPAPYMTDGYLYREFERWGDADDDGELTPTDTDAFLSAFGSSLGQASYRPEFDFNNDGYISIEDYANYFQIYQTVNTP